MFTCADVLTAKLLAGGLASESGFTRQRVVGILSSEPALAQVLQEVES